MSGAAGVLVAGGRCVWPSSPQGVSAAGEAVRRPRVCGFFRGARGGGLTGMRGLLLLRGGRAGAGAGARAWASSAAAGAGVPGLGQGQGQGKGKGRRRRGVGRASAVSESEAGAGAHEGPQRAYPFDGIEPKWQGRWEAEGTFRMPTRPDMSKPKYYVLDMFPYPSGAGLHVGHPEGYTATDILARYKRMRGFNVLHPMGWDAFGLPAEQYAIQTGTHPRETTKRNQDMFRSQLKRLGFSYDWAREVSTTDEAYVRWTQHIFLKLYERGLAYEAEIPVNWCPALGTVLANEEVVDGLSERGGHPVVRRNMRQWVLKITEYAERLLVDLDELDWTESVKEMQRNWIGKSVGADIVFPVDGASGEALTVFTTRPETAFGVTYVALAPEHRLVDALTTEENRASVAAYREAAAAKSDLQRTELQKSSTGVLTGAHAVNPCTGERIPIVVADYVLASYGTGAVMAVPAHDDRDFRFAATLGLPVRQVIEADGADVSKGAWTDKVGTLVGSSNAEGCNIDGLGVKEAAEAVVAWLEATRKGKARVNYKLRDWNFSRQRYWGEPIPIVHVEGEGPRALDDSELPLRLPELESYKPAGDGESPLAGAPDSWLHPGPGLRRETNTMPQWAGSCWYYLRFMDPENAGKLVDPELEQYWGPVDLYVGGTEHAVLHLLYARFWHKVLYDCGLVSTKEPFHRLVNQGMILGEVEYTAFRSKASGEWVSASEVGASDDAEASTPYEKVKMGADEVIKSGDAFVLKADSSVAVDARSFKMSKSRGNVINPDAIVDEYGADSLRLYEMFMGPLSDTKAWQTNGVEGVYRFLARVWRMYHEDDVSAEAAPTAEQKKAIAVCVKKVTAEIEGLRFNTAISAMMEFSNAAKKWPSPRPQSVMEDFALVLSPLAPHLAEECWERMGHASSLSYTAWPEADDSALVESELTIVLQVNGKVRGKLQVPADAAGNQAVVEGLARGEENVAKFLSEGGEVKKVIFVPGKLVNFVCPPAGGKK